MIRAVLQLALMTAAIPAAAVWADEAPWSGNPVPTGPVASRSMNEETNPFRLLGSLAIRGYRLLASPLLPGRCAFSPSCSAYGLEAVSNRGLINGVILGTERIMRCHGFAALGGYDYFPQNGLFYDPLSRNPAPLPWLSLFGF